MSELLSLVFGAFWREWLALIFFAGIGFGEWEIYHHGYLSCEEQVKEATAEAQQSEQIKAITEQDQYQAQAAKLITQEKTKSNSIQVKYDALLKTKHVDCPVDANQLQLYDSTIKTHHSKTTK